MRGSRSRRLAVVGAIAVATLVVDQITKTLAVDHLRDRPRHLFGPVGLDLAYNRGMAFSLGTGLSWPIVVVVTLVVVTLVVVARRTPTATVAVAIGLVLGGALGNLTDRLVRDHGGAVIDFVHVGIWPTFNVADSAIVCGCALLAIRFWRQSGEHVTRPSEATGSLAPVTVEERQVSP